MRAPLASRRTAVVLGCPVSTQTAYIQCRVGKSCSCDVLAWCPWWTVSRSTRTVSVEVMQRHCVRTVVQTHRVWVKCSVIRCVLWVRRTDETVSWRLQVKAVIGCVFVWWLDCTVLHHCGFNLVSLLSVSHLHG